MLTKTHTLVGFALGCIALCGCANAWQRVPWQPPPQGVVRDGKAAIAIARAIWVSMNPDLKISGESSWQTTMTSSLQNGIWRVEEKPLSHQEIGGGLEVDISKHDGQIVGIYLTQ